MWITRGKSTSDITKCNNLNENGINAYQSYFISELSLWNFIRPRGNFTLNAYIRKEEKCQMNNLSLYQQKLTNGFKINTIQSEWRKK